MVLREVSVLRGAVPEKRRFPKGSLNRFAAKAHWQRLNTLRLPFYLEIMGAVVWSGKPYMRKTVVKFILLFAAATLLLLPLWAAVPVLYAVFALASFVGFPLYYYWKSSHVYYVKESSVLITRSWVFGTYQREITLDRIQDVHVQQGFLARMFRCGSVVFTTTTGLEVGYGVGGGGVRGRVAGVVGGGVAVPVLLRLPRNAFLDIPHPERVRELVFEKLVSWREVFQQQRIAAALEKGLEAKPVREEKMKTLSVVDELVKLKKLLEEGAITKEEYEKLKRRLLEGNT